MARGIVTYKCNVMMIIGTSKPEFMMYISENLIAFVFHLYYLWSKKNYNDLEF